MPKLMGTSPLPAPLGHFCGICGLCLKELWKLPQPAHGLILSSLKSDIWVGFCFLSTVGCAPREGPCGRWVCSLPLPAPRVCLLS